jgi:hypothetical protein
VLASTLTMKPEQLGERAARIRNGAVFIYHCAEGQSGSIVAREYVALQQAGCLQDRLVVIHTNALAPAAYGSWTAPGSVVWSPFSNLWLYGTTTDVRAARARGLGVCVGSDWGPSGTRNVLGELKVAALVSDEKGWNLTPLELVKMITANPGDALGKAWNVQAGRLEPKALGDVLVVAARKGADPFDTVVRATERDVLFVVVRGRPLYGTTDLMQAARATRSSAVDVAGERRRLAFARLDTPDVAWSFAEVRARLEEVRAHPKEAIEEARREARAALGEHRPPPLRLALDMPTGRVPIGGLPKDLGRIRVPPIQPLAHDQAFFASIHGRGFHGGLLDRLATFYSRARMKRRRRAVICMRPSAASSSPTTSIRPHGARAARRPTGLGAPRFPPPGERILDGGERLRIIDTLLKVLGGAYCHLPQKRARTIDRSGAAPPPRTRGRSVGRQFHLAVTSILTGLRDAHPGTQARGRFRARWPRCRSSWSSTDRTTPPTFVVSKVSEPGSSVTRSSGRARRADELERHSVHPRRGRLRGSRDGRAPDARGSGAPVPDVPRTRVRPAAGQAVGLDHLPRPLAAGTER